MLRNRFDWYAFRERFLEIRIRSVGSGRVGNSGIRTAALKASVTDFFHEQAATIQVAVELASVNDGVISVERDHFTQFREGEQSVFLADTVRSEQRCNAVGNGVGDLPFPDSAGLRHTSAAEYADETPDDIEAGRRDHKRGVNLSSGSAILHAFTDVDLTAGIENSGEVGKLSGCWVANHRFLFP